MSADKNYTTKDNVIIPGYFQPLEPAITMKTVVEFKIPMYDRSVVESSQLLEKYEYRNFRTDGSCHMLITMDLSNELDVLAIYERLDNILMYGHPIEPEQGEILDT